MTEFSEIEQKSNFLFIFSWVAMIMQHGHQQLAKITNIVTYLVTCQVWARQLQRFWCESKIKDRYSKDWKLCSATLSLLYHNRRAWKTQSDWSWSNILSNSVKCYICILKPYFVEEMRQLLLCKCFGLCFLTKLSPFSWLLFSAESHCFQLPQAKQAWCYLCTPITLPCSIPLT